MQIHHAIFKAEKKLSLEYCKELINYIDVKAVTKARVLIGGKNVEDTKQRNVFDYGLDKDNKKDVEHGKFLMQKMKETLDKYVQTFTYLREASPQTINLLKYEVGNFYSPHIDAFHTVNRQLSFIFCLNENFNGGELYFYHPVTRKPYSQAHLKTGDMILFPSNFLYPHQIRPVTKGTRYSVVAWYS